MGIDFHRAEYEAALPDWKMIDDMCDEKHLSDHIPDLDVLVEKNGLGKTKNDKFKERASFFGATRLTLQSLVGTAFEKDPMVTLPPKLGYMLKNVDGGGSDIWQQMQAATGQVIRKARCGLFVTMPATEGPTSVADQEAGRVLATIHLIDARRIINWWTTRDGAETILAGVIFTDTQETIDNYEVKAAPIRRELALDEAGNFFDRTWRKADKGKDEWIADDPIYPRQGNGALWRRIPFMFLGAEANSWSMQTPPMISIARKNRDHLRNSAINEEGIWFSGHIQPVADEMDAAALDTLLKAQGEGGFKIGGGQLLVAMGFRFEVAEPNTAARQAMIDKAEEMAALGARFLQAGTVAKTATQSSGEAKIGHSVLSLVSVNVEDGYQWAVEQAAIYMNESGSVEVKLNRSFMEPEVTAEKMREIRETVLAGMAPAETMFRALQRSGDLPPEMTLEQYQAQMDQAGTLLDRQVEAAIRDRAAAMTQGNPA